MLERKHERGPAIGESQVRAPGREETSSLVVTVLALVGVGVEPCFCAGPVSGEVFVSSRSMHRGSPWAGYSAGLRR
jgi:hypothetical protein